MLLILLSFWLGWTVLVDFVVVPAVFRNINNFFEAGDLGIFLFTRLNYLEVVVSAVVLSVITFIYQKNARALPILIAGCIVTVISLVYFSYLIPKIAELSELWKISEAGKTIAISDIQQEHQYFHRVYVIIDSVKILTLMLMMVSAVGKEEWTA
jgi:hypothetical protein